MATVQDPFLTGCCSSTNQCCSSTITGVWYLCLAIVVMVILISCNDLLKSRCYFIGLPWSKSKLYYIHETVEEEEEIQLLLVLDDDSHRCDRQCYELKKETPPPPYSAIHNSGMTIPVQPMKELNATVKPAGSKILIL